MLLRNPATDTRLDLLFEGPLLWGPEALPKRYWFRKAVEDIQTTNEVYVVQTENSNFQVSPVPALAGESGTSICLRNLFQKANSRPNDQNSKGFWQDDQFDLAIKVVEAGLYLLGTSWLSNLSSGAVIQVTSVRDSGPRYFLHLARWPIPYRNAKLPHLFRIGVVLAEIALLETLVKADDMPQRCGGPQGILGIDDSYYIFTNSGPSCGGLKKTIEYSFGRMISNIKRRMSPMVGRAIEFCLRASSAKAFSASESLPSDESKHKARIDAYEKVLDDYRTQVYDP
jgi:hypothetical protein